jgi:Sec-independent protein translocase protein TatA
MFRLGVVEVLIVLAFVLFVFGRGRLPQLWGNLRQAMRNFKLMAQGENEIDVTPTATDDSEQKGSRHGR